MNDFYRVKESRDFRWVRIQIPGIIKSWISDEFENITGGKRYRGCKNNGIEVFGIR